MRKYYHCSIFYYYPILLLSILFSSCIQENEALVYPPLIVETVNIRYFNLHNDEMQRTLILDEKNISENQSFNTISNPEFPPYDSVTLQVKKGGGNITYKSIQKFKFARQSNYIMVALPDYRQKPDTGIRYEDTIVYLQTTILKPNDTNQCFVKFLNANPDTGSTYSIKIGCPNGEDFFVDNGIVSVSYLQSTGVQAVYEGKRVISIIKNNKNTTDSTIPNKKVIGIFELDLNRLGQYALIINKNDEVFFIDELNANFPLIKLNNVEARNAYVRVINMSSDNITINSSAQGNITSNLNSNFIDNYKNITTCDALSLDKLTLETDGTNDSTYMSFDIYKKYSILAFDTKNKIAGKIIAVPPIDDRMKTKPDKAIIRVVNGNVIDYGITISIGARSADNDIGYESGTTLAVNLLDGEYSKEMYINGGTLPISVFASTQPTQYLFSSIISIQNGKEYIITIDGLDTGKISAIEINDEVMAAEYGKSGSFLQFVNVCNGNNLLSFNIPDIINNGKLYSTNSLATFIPTGSNSVQTTTETYNFNANLTQRTLLIATSAPSNPTLFAMQNENMGANSYTLKFRFINAADDIPTLQINTDSTTIFITDIPYKSASYVSSYTQDKKYSFMFVNPSTGKIEYKANDLLMTLNKNYSIIFYGNKSAGYGIFITQEY